MHKNVLFETIEQNDSVYYKQRRKNKIIKNA